MSQRSPDQPWKQAQDPSGLHRPWELQFASSSQAVPHWRSNRCSPHTRPFETLQVADVHPAKHAQDPVVPEHRPWPLQFFISSHAELQLRPNWCSMQICLAETLHLGDSHPSKHMHTPLSPEHRPCPLQFTISLQAREHSELYVFILHGSHLTPPKPPKQLHDSFTHFPWNSPPQSASEEHV